MPEPKKSANFGGILLAALLVLSGCQTSRHLSLYNPAASETQPVQPSPNQSVQTAAHYLPPSGYSVYPWGTPLTAFPRLLRTHADTITDAPGTIKATQFGCEQYDRKTHCKRPSWRQSQQGEGSYAFAIYIDTRVGSPFDADGAVIKRVLFCYHAANASLPRNLSVHLTLCGAEYLFRTETRQQEVDRRHMQDHNIDALQRQLNLLPSDDERRTRILNARNTAQQSRDQYQTPDDHVLASLLTTYGPPDPYQRTGRIDIETIDGEIVTLPPLRPLYTLYRWCAPPASTADPTCSATITMACEIGMSGWCSVVTSTPLIYDWARTYDSLSRKKEKRGYWLWSLLTASSTGLLSQRPDPENDCNVTAACDVTMRPLQEKDLQMFDPQAPSDGNMETLQHGSRTRG